MWLKTGFKKKTGSSIIDMESGENKGLRTMYFPRQLETIGYFAN